MATRQYIGARYVVKIYENSVTAGSAEWEANTSYEPLTMVTYQNSSYLSKKAVPASVGNPAVETGYWVVTGAYNGQIAELQNAIAALNTKIGDLTNLPTTDKDSIVDAIIELSSEIGILTKPPILCFGDSFATISNSWITKLANLIDNPIYHKELSGTGFVGNVGTSWNNLVSSAASDTNIPNDDIRLIIFAGGTNDVGKSNVNTAMAGAITNAKTNFPNADIMVVFISFYPHKMADVGSTINTYITTCQSMGVRFNDISTNIKITKDAVDTDRNHPTNIGETVIAGCIYNLIKGNKIIPYNSFVGVGTSPLLVSVQGDLARFESHSTFAFPWSTDTAITLNGTPHFDVTLDAESDGYVGILERNNENYIWGNTVGYFQWGGNYHLCDMAFKINENKIEIHPRCIESGSFLEVPANTNGTIEITRLSTTFPANFL